MRVTRNRVVVARIMLAALVLLLAACADGGAAGSGTQEKPSPPPPREEPTLSSGPGEPCPEVIPDDVPGALGWPSGEPAREDRGGCGWQGPEGTIHVVQSAQTFEKACEGLQTAAEDTTFRHRVDNPASLPACGYVRTTELGLSEVAVEVEGQVVLLEVAALTPTDPELVREALLSLTASAAAST